MKKEILDVIKTRQLLVYDDQDKLRISLFAGVGVEPKIILHRKNESPALQISHLEEDGDSCRLLFHGENGVWRMLISSRESGSGVTIWDEKGNLLGSWGKRTGAPSADQ
jgi:hypothetical protein